MGTHRLGQPRCEPVGRLERGRRRGGRRIRRAAAAHGLDAELTGGTCAAGTLTSYELQLLEPVTRTIVQWSLPATWYIYTTVASSCRVGIVNATPMART